MTAAADVLTEPVLTDDRGEFVLRLAAAAPLPVRVTAGKAGFADLAIEVTRTAIDAGRSFEVRLARGAALSGRVITPAGVPVVAAFVVVQPEAARPDAAALVRTNDRREYRVGGCGEAPRIGLRLLPTDFDRSPAGGLASFGAARLEAGEVVINGVTGPRRLTLMSPSEGWFIESATVGGEDVLDRPFDFGLEAKVFDDLEVVLSNASSTVSGRVVDAAGAAVMDYAVAVFSADRSLWYRNSQRLAGGSWAATARFA